MHFVTCPKQGLEMEAVVLHRVGVLEYFDLNRVRISNPANMGQVPPPPPGVEVQQKKAFKVSLQRSFFP